MYSLAIACNCSRLVLFRIMRCYLLDGHSSDHHYLPPTVRKC